MVKNSKQLLAEIEKLSKKNSLLQQQLREAKESINAVKTGTIDALVVTSKKKLQVYTQETSDKIFRILIEKMHEGAVTLSENGTILYCNSHFATMVNLNLQKVIGANFKKFIDDSLGKHFDVLLKQDWESYVQEEVNLYTIDGSAIPVMISVNKSSLNGNFLLSVIITDLTIQHKSQKELKRRTKQLEKKNRELESANSDLTSFTYVSSHDLQEPLRKIQNFVTCILLEEEKNLSEIGKLYFFRMSETAKRMQALIEDLLAYSRTKSKERNFETINLNFLTDEVFKEFEDVLQEKKSTIDIAKLGKAYVIPFQFRQLLHNLISNTIKFSHAHLPLHITVKSNVILGKESGIKSLSAKKKYLHLTFADNGIGFDPKYNERIFEVFQRLHSMDTYKGTGIGLAICKRIMENHHGIITATGEVNKGSQFDIYLPVK